ncbi:GNAT family N-acetyltransferase [Rhizobium sp. FY34]|uniref:GNAT family N-acetyltransferase n=1 Tax=Rhizobium sp. FY34 TaxID=2562309 RepID=UPI0010BFBA8D|nr:GNAT family N-acetyltransferase [Rhizobium sp. FY34]
MKEIRIEPIREAHVEGFHKALDIVARERRYLSFLEAPPLDGTRDFVLDNIRNGHPQFVAIAEGQVIGWCDLRRHQREVHAHRCTLGMGIVPGYRDCGLGRRLITTTIEAARALKLHRIDLDVYADNLRAKALYEKVGFVTEGVARDGVRIDGRFIDVIQMALLLD